MLERRRLQVRGIVQGVGFRPFVFGLAHTHGLAGQVWNDSSGVTIEVEGETAAIQQFVTLLQLQPPPLATIERLASEALPPHGSTGFAIEPSRAGDERRTLIAPDVSVCADCLRELFDPRDRRYRYPFINCTNCGPRFTIVRDVPYDRPLTTMAGFTMCPDCQREYDDPLNRRFHAQPIACPVCGPQVRLRLSDPPASIAIGGQLSADAIEAAQQLLAAGAILAVKGLGGYHLACDAANDAAVQQLRQRKQRWDKPLALMAADGAAVEAVAYLSAEERASLEDRCRPIVLLRRRPGAGVAPDVAPQLDSLGLMLPYTPLHHLLFDGAPFNLLVMTSGNLSDEPIAYEDADALARLAPLADAFLTHNRGIQVRCDDSVVKHVPRPVMIRRSRGFAPQPLTLHFECSQPLLAVGGHLKNVFCLANGRQAFLSHYLGDLGSVPSLLAFREGIEHFQRLFNVAPQVIAHDLHPSYLSTQYALEPRGPEGGPLRCVGVQHHHAHIASVLAEHGLPGPVIGVAFDGSGYGLDGAVWGGEVLVADLAGFERVAHLAPVAMPGGEQAIRQPWRMAAAWLEQLYGEAWLRWPLPMTSPDRRAEIGWLRQMLQRGVNSPLTTSMGRLFDAVAALVGVRAEAAYEGQAAVELEALADHAVRGGYRFTWDGRVAHPAPVFAAILNDLAALVPVPVIAARFHNAVVNLILAACQSVRSARGLNVVALSGGVFQNSLLLSRALDALAANDFETYINQRVPANDGGLALGQAAVAAHKE